MDDDAEVLDWTNEEDEESEPAPKTPSLELRFGQDNNPADDDGEDAISLGDEDEDQGFYDEHRIDAPSLPNSTIVEENRRASTSSAKLEADTFGANGHSLQQPSPRVIREHQRTPSLASSASRELLSPQKSGKGQMSPPQRSSMRVYHALPPKPVPITVPPLPPSHPSITAATSMTTVSPRAVIVIREPMKPISSVATPAPNGSPADLPQDWQTRTSKTTGETYYYNCVTEESSWTFPKSGSKIDSSNEDTLDHDMENATRPALVTTRIDRIELTNEDRYYRPESASSASVSLEARAGRLEISSELSASQGRRERSPTSPRRKRARSNSPIAIRVAEPSLERESTSSRSGRRKARTDATAARVADRYIPERDLRLRRRSVSPRNSSQANDSERVFRRGLGENPMQVDHPDQRPGRLLSRQEDVNQKYRGRSRDGDYPPTYARQPDSHEPPYQTYQTSQRSRSPPQRTEARYADRGREPEPGGQERERWDRDTERDLRHPDPAPSSRYRDVSTRPLPESASRSGREREPASSRFERQDHPPPHLVHETSLTKQGAAVQPRQRNRDRPSGMDSYRPKYEDDRHQTAERDRSPPRRYERDVDIGHREPPRNVNRHRPEPQLVPTLESRHEELTRPSPPEQPAPAPPRRGAPLPPQHDSFRQRAVPQQTRSSARDHPSKGLSPPATDNGLSSSSPVQSLGPRALPASGSSSETRIADRHGHSSNDRHYSPERPYERESDKGKQSSGGGSFRGPDAPKPDEPSRLGQDRRPLPPTGPANERREGPPRPMPERTNSKRRRGAKLSGTNEIPIANRRTGFNLAVATPQLAAQPLVSGIQLPPAAFDTRVPTGPRESAGKLSYDRPLDQPPSDHAPRGGRATRPERNHSRAEPESKSQDDRGRGRDRPAHPMTPSLSANGLSSRDVIPFPLSREDSVFSSTLDESSARQSADEKEPQLARLTLDGFDSALAPLSRISPQDVRPLPTTPPQPERQSALEYSLSPSLQRRLSMSGDPLPPRLRKAIPSPEPKKTQPEDLSSPPDDRSSFLDRVERPGGPRRSGSLLDRMNSDHISRRGLDDSATLPNQSLRERMVPNKRDHEEMRMESRYGGMDRTFEAEDGHESKRSRKRSGKPRRVSHAGGGGGGGGRRYGP